MNVPQISNASLPTQSASGVREGGQRTVSTSTAKTASGSSIPAQAERTRASTESQERRTAPQAESEQLKEAVKEINRAMQQSNRALEFSVDEETDRLVVRLKDGETGETIRQYPSDETLAIARYIADVQHGLLLSQKA